MANYPLLFSANFYNFHSPLTVPVKAVPPKYCLTNNKKGVP